MVKVPVNILGVKLFENGFPQLVALKVELCGADGNLSQRYGILDSEYVNILDGDWDDDWVHGIIDFDVVPCDVLIYGGDVEIDEELDVVLS